MIAWNGGMGEDWQETERCWQRRQLARELAEAKARARAEAEAFRETVAKLRNQQRYENQQAFRRPPKRCGRGRPPLRKWEARRR